MSEPEAKAKELTILPEPPEAGSLAVAAPHPAIVEWWHPKNLTEAMAMAEMLADSQVVPKGFVGMPGNILVAIQMGAEVGLPPMAALQNIAVINGRPALWGDAQLAVCMASPDFDDVIEKFEGPEPKGGKYDDAFTAVCVAKRIGKSERVRTFSVADAKKAGLWGGNVWAKYPKRMLQMRARGFALRDTWPDRLRGLRHNVEELRDLEVVETQVVKLEDGVHKTVPVKDTPSEEPKPNSPEDVGFVKTGEDPRKDVTKVIDEMGGAETLDALNAVAKSELAQSLDGEARDAAKQKFIERREMLKAETPKGDGDPGFGFEP